MRNGIHSPAYIKKEDGKHPYCPVCMTRLDTNHWECKCGVYVKYDNNKRKLVTRLYKGLW